MGKLHETIYGKDHPDKAGTHYAWYWWCPGCKSIHSCDSRWGFNGNQEKPTFTGSILVYEYPGSHPRCHSYVVDGRIQFLSDCGHDLKGQTVDLPDWKGHDPASYT